MMMMMMMIMMMIMMMMMIMINCFRRMVDLQTTGAVFLEQTIFRKPQHHDFPTRRDKSRYRIAETATRCATAPRSHVVVKQMKNKTIYEIHLCV